MSKTTEEYVRRTEALIDPILKENHFELWDVEYVKEGSNYYLRAFIDKEGGINIDDCELVSRALSDKLDEEDYIDNEYILEISSPGLGRQLKKDRDLERSIGEEVEIHLYQVMDGSKEYNGILRAYDAGSLTVEREDGTQLVLERKNISLVRLAFDF